MVGVEDVGKKKIALDNVGAARNRCQRDHGKNLFNSLHRCRMARSGNILDHQGTLSRLRQNAMVILKSYYPSHTR